MPVQCFECRAARLLASMPAALAGRDKRLRPSMSRGRHRPRRFGNFVRCAVAIACSDSAFEGRRARSPRARSNSALSRATPSLLPRSQQRQCPRGRIGRPIPTPIPRLLATTPLSALSAADPVAHSHLRPRRARSAGRWVAPPAPPAITPPTPRSPPRVRASRLDHNPVAPCEHPRHQPNGTLRVCPSAHQRVLTSSGKTLSRGSGRPRALA